MKQTQFNNQAQRFSIRKYSLGAASVLLGASLICGQAVKADEVVVSANEVSEVLLADVPEIAIVAEVPEAIPATATSVVETPITNQTQTEDLTVVTPSISQNKTNVATNLTLEVAPAPVIDIEELLAEVPVFDLVAPESSSQQVAVAEYNMTTSSNTKGLVGDDYPNKWKGIEVEDNWGYYTGNCTSFVANRLHNVNKFTTPRAMGNGGQWGYAAKAMGYKVDKTPAIGSVAWLDDGGYGHVAWVAAIDGSTITIEEYNHNWDYQYHTRTLRASSFSGFIHFKDLTGPVTATPTSSQEATGKPATNSGNATLAPSGTYTFTSSAAIKSEAKVSAKALAHYAAGEQVNYDSVLEADNHQWISYLSFSGARRYISVGEVTSATQETPATTKAEPTIKGKMTIKNLTNKGYEVIISDVFSDAGVKEVQVPTWSDKNGQDDISWYKATKQADGTYKVKVNVSKHNNDKGIYHNHLYYVLNDGQTVGVSTSQTTVPTKATKQTPSRPNIPNKGTYTFTQSAGIKSAAKMSSPDLATYDAGESVNYDKVMLADGHYWISYLSFSGARRYISIA